MSRPGPEYDIGRELQFFADPETTFGTAGSDSPAAADAVRVIDAAVNGSRPFTAYEDRRGTSSRLGIVDEKGTAEWSVNLYAYPSGTAGVAPDWADLLTSGGWSAITGTGTTVDGGSSTSTLIDVVDATGLAVGGAVIISGQIRRITALTPNTITISPALSAPPVNATTVSAGISYAPDDERADSQKSLTIWAANNRSLARVVGGVPTSFAFALGGTGAAKVSIEGTGRRQDTLLATRIDGGINGIVTSVTVDEGTAAPSDATTFWQIGSEIVSVSAVAGAVWTIARGVLGSTAASHADDAVIYPYTPTGTYAGTPVPATSGTIIVGGATLAMQSATAQLGMGVVTAEGRHGDAFALDHYIVGQREMSVALEGWAKFDTNMVRALRAINRTSQEVLVQQGATLGSIVAVSMPSCYIEQPAISRGGDEITLSLSAQAFGTASEDEAYILVG